MSLTARVSRVRMTVPRRRSGRTAAPTRRSSTLPLTVRIVGLDVAFTRSVVAQALHVAENGNHHLVKSTLTAVQNDLLKHAISATHGGNKTPLGTYAGYTRRLCA